MAEQPTIITDPISSDGSEESWVLLDELDEAINDIENVGHETPIETITDTSIPAISIETATEALPMLTLQRTDDDHHSIDAIDTSPSDECDISDTENLYR